MFRVFPFNARERRTTGIEFMHYEPIKVEIDGNPIQMGSTESTDNSYKNESFIYLSSKAKASLPTVARTPYYHFIIDCSNPTMTKTIGSFRASLGSRATDEEISETKENKVKILEEQINQVLSRKAIPSGKVLISFSDYRTQTFNLDQNWKEAYRASEFKGGFFLDRTIKESLVASYFSHKAEYPVFVVISDNLENAVRNQSLTDIPYTFPESSSFFHLKPNASLSEYSFQNFKEVEPVADEASPFARKNVHIWKNQNGDQFFFPVDGEGALIIQNFNKITKETTGKTALDQALALQAMSMKMDLMPEQTGELWLPIIKESFSSKIMTPHTSYLVVENEAQEKALLAKQQQVLNAKKSLDIDEEERMSEPEFWIILILFIAFVAWKRRRALITVL
jgi:hypothetical protein